VAKKRALGRYPKAFRKMAVERLESCENIVALSQELGVHRRLLYKWRDQLAPVEDGEQAPANSREGDLLVVDLVNRYSIHLSYGATRRNRLAYLGLPKRGVANRRFCCPIAGPRFPASPLPSFVRLPSAPL
jgi:hypothetical protein